MYWICSITEILQLTFAMVSENLATETGYAISYVPQSHLRHRVTVGQYCLAGRYTT